MPPGLAKKCVGKMFVCVCQCVCSVFVSPADQTGTPVSFFFLSDQGRNVGVCVFFCFVFFREVMRSSRSKRKRKGSAAAAAAPRDRTDTLAGIEAIKQATKRLRVCVFFLSQAGTACPAQRNL